MPAFSVPWGFQEEGQPPSWSRVSRGTGSPVAQGLPWHRVATVQLLAREGRGQAWSPPLGEKHLRPERPEPQPPFRRVGLR